MSNVSMVAIAVALLGCPSPSASQHQNSSDQAGKGNYFLGAYLSRSSEISLSPQKDSVSNLLEDEVDSGACATASGAKLAKRRNRSGSFDSQSGG